MAKAIPYPIREQIVRLYQQGKSYKDISKEVGYSYDGVRKICRLYRKGGKANLKICYTNCGRHPLIDQTIWKEVKEFLTKNDQLGAPIIRSKLLVKHKDLAVPHERTIQRWMKRHGYNQPRGRRPKVSGDYTRKVNHTWQVDGKEDVELKTKQKTCWLSIVDEGTAGFLEGYVFTKKNT